MVISTLETSINLIELKELQQHCRQVKVSDALLDYIQRVIAYTRESPDFSHGLSPRGAMALLASAKSWAFMEDRNYVVPEDVQAVLPAVVEHRLRESADFTDHVGSALASKLLSSVDVIG